MKAGSWLDVDRIVTDALALPQERRTGFVDEKCAGHPELAAEVLSLLAEIETRGPLDLIDEADAASDGAAGSLAGRRLGPYRLVEEIGRGGMGAVWLADRDDRQFEKRVAVKLLASGLPATEALRRFRDERQILASLEHPNIARLLDAGRSEDGLHYIVMEYVDGVPITEYCRSCALDVPARVTLLRTIASTVHFAHERLVVHRDLKPANILVARDGAPRLLDFGIAKMLAPDSSVPSTVPLLHLVTPAYASPEQLRGLAATASSDVFSLGVLCYELVTGTLPDRTRADGFAAPALHRDRELQAIVAKAMRDVPAERYSSAGELADDLGRYLRHVPVAALQANTAYRIRRFLARHRAWVAAGAAALAIAAAGLGAIAWQAHVATRERLAAEARVNDVRRLARSMMFDVYDRIAELPGSTAPRQALVTQALQNLDRLSRERGTHRDLAVELAQAYLRIAQVQFSGNVGSLGDTAGALASYGTARRILEEQLARTPADTEIRRLIAKTHEELSNVHSYLRRPADSKASAEAALMLRQALANSGDPADQRGLATAYFQLGTALEPTDEAAAQAAKLRALEIFDSILAARPADADAQRNVALTCKSLGASFSDAGRPDEAERYYRRALALDEARVAAAPGSAVARMDVSFDLSSLASLLANRGDAEALRLWDRTIAIRREVVAADAKDVRGRTRLAYALLESGVSRLRLVGGESALEQFQEAATLTDYLVSLNPNDGIARSYAGKAWTHIAQQEQSLARRAGSRSRAVHVQRSCDAVNRALGHYGHNEMNGRSAAADREDIELARRLLGACAPR